MTFHYWGEDFDFKAVDDASYFIGEYLKRWGRVDVHETKGKFGSARVYCSLGWYSFHNITHPGHAFIRYKPWMCWIDNHILTHLVVLINPLVYKYHKWLYRKSYKLALKKWPYIREEILCCADFPEYLKGL